MCIGRFVGWCSRLFFHADQSEIPVGRAIHQRRVSRARRRTVGQRCVVAVERDGAACATVPRRQRTRGGRGAGRWWTRDRAPVHDRATGRFEARPFAGEPRVRAADGRPAEPDDAAAEFRRPDDSRRRRVELRRRLQRRHRAESLFRRRELLLCDLQPDRDAAPGPLLDGDLLERLRGRALRRRMVGRGGAVRPHRRSLVRQPVRAGARERTVVSVLCHFENSRSDTAVLPVRVQNQRHGVQRLSEVRHLARRLLHDRATQQDLSGSRTVRRGIRAQQDAGGRRVGGVRPLHAGQWRPSRRHAACGLGRSDRASRECAELPGPAVVVPTRLARSRRAGGLEISRRLEYACRLDARGQRYAQSDCRTRPHADSIRTAFHSRIRPRSSTRWRRAI